MTVDEFKWLEVGPFKRKRKQTVTVDKQTELAAIVEEQEEEEEDLQDWPESRIGETRLLIAPMMRDIQISIDFNNGLS
jgi:hypothetical protein